MNEIIYLSLDDILIYYCDIIEQSGGGISGIREKGGIEMILDLVQDDYIILLSKKSLHILSMLSVLDIISPMVINVYHLLLVLIFSLRIGMDGLIFISCLIWRLIFGMWQQAI